MVSGEKIYKGMMESNGCVVKRGKKIIIGKGQKNAGNLVMERSNLMEKKRQVNGCQGSVDRETNK